MKEFIKWYWREVKSEATKGHAADTVMLIAPAMAILFALASIVLRALVCPAEALASSLFLLLFVGGSYVTYLVIRAICSKQNKKDNEN